MFANLITIAPMKTKLLAVPLVVGVCAVLFLLLVWGAKELVMLSIPTPLIVAGLIAETVALWFLVSIGLDKLNNIFKTPTK